MDAGSTGQWSASHIFKVDGANQMWVMGNNRSLRINRTTLLSVTGGANFNAKQFACRYGSYDFLFNDYTTQGCTVYHQGSTSSVKSFNTSAHTSSGTWTFRGFVQSQDGTRVMAIDTPSALSDSYLLVVNLATQSVQHRTLIPRISGYRFGGAGSGFFNHLTNEYIIIGSFNGQTARLVIDATTYTFKSVSLLSVQIPGFSNAVYSPVTDSFIFSGSGSRTSSAGNDGVLGIMTSGNTGYAVYSKLLKVSDDVNEYPLDEDNTRIEASGKSQQWKTNIISDPDYIPPQYNTSLCPIDNPET